MVLHHDGNVSLYIFLKRENEYKRHEEVYKSESQHTNDHILHQTDSSRIQLMSMRRKTKRFIWRLNMRCKTYTALPLGYKWGEEEYCTTASLKTFSVMVQLWDIDKNDL